MGISHGAHQPSVLDSISKPLSSFFPWRNEGNDISDLMLTPFEAVKELERRQRDPELLKRVEKYLAGDIPEYFKDGPILCLARQIATPNFETVRFIRLMGNFGIKIVITQDSKGLFVSQNHVKRVLCKLPVCQRITQKNGKLHEHYQNVTIVDFNIADGKAFSDIRTLWGEGLVDFHTRLFSELLSEKIESPDDAAWIDRHHRGNLLEHYKHLLALFVAHGLFFENSNMDDPQEVNFVRDILRPACRSVEERFGYRPIITQVFPSSFESYHFWLSYPRKVLDIVRKSMGSNKDIIKAPI